MQLAYSTDELVHLITTNNLAAVFNRLVLEGRVDALMLPNVDAIAFAIQEQAGRLSPEAFLSWLETLLDVPVDQSRMYASELTAIRQSVGKSPARLLTDQIRNAPMQNAAGSVQGNRWGSGREGSGGREGLGDREGRPYATWLVLGLAIIGLLCVLRYLGRILKKFAN